MKKRVFTTCGALIVLGSVLVLSSCSTIPQASNRPNIVLISADTLGALDLQEYARYITGEKKRQMYHETPNLDRLCAEGLSFEQAHSCAHQIPSAEGILTGRITAARGTGKSGAAAKGVTIAEVLVDYDCAFIGKWQATGTPTSAGFDQKGLPAAGLKGSPADIAEQAGRYIEDRSRMRHRPFFLYVNHSLSGSSALAKETDLAHFKNKRTKGWHGQSDPHHAAMVKALDDSVGQILHKLWRNGLENKTIVIFMPAQGSASTATEDHPKSSTTCDARVPLIIRWNSHVQADKWSKVAVDQADILPTLMYCAGYFPESLDGDAGVDGCSLSGLFWDPHNKAASYDRDQQCERCMGTLVSPVANSRR